MMFIWIIHHVRFAYVNHVPCWINKKKWTYYIVTLVHIIIHPFWMKLGMTIEKLGCNFPKCS